MGEKIKLISLERLQEFWEKVKAYIDSKFNTVSKKTDAVIWKGKEEDIDAAILSGDIIPGFTQVILSDSSDDIVIQYTTMQEIYDLFNLTYNG